RSQPAAVDIVDAAQIDHEVAIALQMVLHELAQGDRLLAEKDPPMTIHDGDAVNGSRSQLQVHNAFLFSRALPTAIPNCERKGYYSALMFSRARRLLYRGGFRAARPTPPPV